LAVFTPKWSLRFRNGLLPAQRIPGQPVGSNQSAAASPKRRPFKCCRPVFGSDSSQRLCSGHPGRSASCPAARRSKRNSFVEAGLGLFRKRGKGGVEGIVLMRRDDAEPSAGGADVFWEGTDAQGGARRLGEQRHEVVGERARGGVGQDEQIRAFSVDDGRHPIRAFRRQFDGGWTGLPDSSEWGGGSVSWLNTRRCLPRDRPSTFPCIVPSCPCRSGAWFRCSRPEVRNAIRHRAAPVRPPSRP